MHHEVPDGAKALYRTKQSRCAIALLLVYGVVMVWVGINSYETREMGASSPVLGGR